MNVSIVIADDHGVLRGGLRSMLNAEKDLRVIGEAEDGHRALKLTRQLRPDVLLADISMPGPNGIELARELCLDDEPTNVIILTMHEDASLMYEAQQAGARGYVSKRSAESELIRAIRTVMTGAPYWPPDEVPATWCEQQQADKKTQPDLLPDEARLLLLIARACTNLQIAGELNLTLEQVEQKRRQVMDKLGLRTRVDIFRYAQEEGLI